MKKLTFFLILLFLPLPFSLAGWINPLVPANSAASPVVQDDSNTNDNAWVEMPAGAKPSYMGIHGGTMPVSLLVSDDGSSLLGFVGRTGNDFLEVLRNAYSPFPSFANATREKFNNLLMSSSNKLFAGNATASMPVISLAQGPGLNPDWISYFQPFGLSEEPLDIEGNVSRPEIVPLPRKYRIFFLPDKFFPTTQ